MDVKQSIAGNLRRLRAERRLSLDGAAARTGVSKSMLGQIERGEVNPTISVLWRIAEGLRVPFTQLLRTPAPGAELVRAGSVPVLRADGGRYRNTPVFPGGAECGMEQYRIDIDPGGGLAARPHMAGTQEYLLVFSGMLTVTVDGRDHLLAAGDGLRFAADVPHAYANHADTPVALSMVITYTGR